MSGSGVVAVTKNDNYTSMTNSTKKSVGPVKTDIGPVFT